MASESQALTRSYRTGAANLSKTARQVVPQFLQKLYEMVNDPNNNELIRWSDSGDSFFVLDHERFAREVLGRWFKHQNFASFVRQLNMYGFHKIPHLQQGVLRSETETELWNFEHPNFHRAQPDLLCLIQRKKQAAAGDDSTADSAPATATAGQQANNAQVLDVNSIVNGIAAIKRHQQTISADLNELKSSNQHLWQEALAARERHKAHQDTINRILKFLASVFGRAGAHDPEDHERHSPSPPLVVRRGQRLLIGNGSEGKSKGVEVVEVDDDDTKSVAETVRSEDNGHSYARIETPSVASPSVAHPSPAPTAFSPASATTPYMGENGLNSHVPNAASAVELRRPQSTQPNASAQIVPPGATGDALLQLALQQIMQSPGQMQRFMQALTTSPASQPLPQQTIPLPTSAQPISVPPFMQYPQPLPPPAPSTQSQPQRPQMPARPPSELAIYNKLTDLPLLPIPTASTSTALDFPPLLSVAPKAEEPDGAGLAMHDARLHGTYQDAATIDADVDALQASINSLIENMGVDPRTLPAAGSGSGAQTPDFDFDAFLTQFADEDGGGGGGADEGGSGGAQLQFLEDAVPAAQAQMQGLPHKRASDVAELGIVDGRTKRNKK